jgi:UDP:flavonoid glycosyltransferase YjiC (YdhE family)
MEPFLAIGEILKEKGHEITCLFPEQFRSLAEDAGFEFASLGEEFIHMLDSPAGKIAMGGGRFGWKKLRAYLKLIAVQQAINKQMILKQEAVIEALQPDRIVHNGKAIYPVIWSLKHEGQTTLISPVPYLHYVRDHAHVAFNKNLGPFINKLTYKIANFGLVKTIMGSLKWLSESGQIRQKEVQKALFGNKAAYTISPSLFKRPDYWPDNLQVLGYHERSKTNNWTPSEGLQAFLDKHSRVILVTFGSMINTDPPQKSKIILDILEKNSIPAIINTASGGLVKPPAYNEELFHFVERIPYDWIFPKMYAVIHHGGSGTTHTALKYGCASLIIPHIIDQYVWNKIISKKGLGPLGMDVSRITLKNLESSILDLLNNKSYKEQAVAIGQQIQNENFKSALHEFIVVRE